MKIHAFVLRLSNPLHFARLVRFLLPLLGIAATLTFGLGLYQALLISPPDYQQGETARIMYVHVPAAWVSMALYGVMAVAAALHFITKHPMADAFCVSAAPVGAVLVALCLATGSLWGKPTWGAWWVWDARLTSVLVLFLLYCGFIVLRQSFENESQGAQAGAVLLLLGAVNLPIIKFSVDWWHTLHQPASLLRSGGSALHPAMLKPLLIMAAAYALYTAALVLLRMRSAFLARKIDRVQFSAD